ncbi:hypothetical protein N431DRAFT_325218 [Stipitochalara longipes BDJ]|nr:hypothetical protein N431DRAFT_325218 [Stipitochalara longipes BDJ]
MELFERNYGLKACTRTWKAKLKEWKFEKYVTDKENGMRVVTAEKRGREANKTAVPHGKRPISPGQMAPFKKRKDEKGTEVMPQKSATPPELTHNTPSLAEGNDPVCEFHAHRAFRQLKTLDGSFQNSNTSLVNSITSAGLNGAYSASLRMFKTVKNDSTLFLAAMAAGLVRILVRNLEEELKGEIKIRNLGGKYNFLWWTGGTSGTDIVMFAQSSSKDAGIYHTALIVTTTRGLFVKLKIIIWCLMNLQYPLHVELRRNRMTQEFAML